MLAYMHTLYGKKFALNVSILTNAHHSTYCRSENIQESRKLSIQRGVDLSDLEVNGPGQARSPSTRRRKEPPVPPTKVANKVPLPPQPPQVTFFFFKTVTVVRNILHSTTTMPLCRPFHVISLLLPPKCSAKLCMNSEKLQDLFISSYSQL